MSPARAFATVFLFVFLFIFLGSALITYLMPRSYRATARVLAPGPAQLEAFQSTKLLSEISRQLDLPRVLAERYGETEPMEQKYVTDTLRRSIQVRRVRGTDLLEIRASSHSPAEAAQLANAAAVAGTTGSDAAKIIEAATPPAKPSRPNVGFNLVVGALVGIFLGTMAAGVGAKLAVGFDGKD